MYALTVDQNERSRLFLYLSTDSFCIETIQTIHDGRWPVWTDYTGMENVRSHFLLDNESFFLLQIVRWYYAEMHTNR